jgi:MFS family permease
VYTLTANPFLLGLTNFASQVPVLALAVFGGLVADVFDRHRTVITTQALLMLQAFALGTLTLWTDASGQPVIQIWHVLLLATLAGAVQAFDMPARQSFIPQLVPRQDLNNAIALNSLTFNAARVVGPSLAGIIIALFQKLQPHHRAFGEGMCFLLNGLSFLAVIAQLRRMDRRSFPTKHDATVERSLADGLDYLLDRRYLVYLIVTVGAVSFTALPYVVIIPAVAKDVLHGDATTLGWIMTSVGIGAIGGGLRHARRQRVRGLGGVIVRSLMGFSAVMVALGLQHNTLLTCLGFMTAGFFVVNATISAQTLVQSLVSEHYRGRVMSYYTMMSHGMTPFGSLLLGAEAHHFGTSASLMITGAMTFVVAAIFSFCWPTVREALRASPEYADLLEREKLAHGGESEKPLEAEEDQ